MRVLGAAFVVGLLLLAVGCAPDRDGSPTPSLVVLGMAEDGTTIRVTGSQQIAFRLPVTPSNGYAWSMSQSPDQMLQKIGERRFEPGTDAGAGRSGFAWQNVRPVTAGEVDVLLELREPTRLEPAVKTIGFKIVASDVSPIPPNEAPLGFAPAAADDGASGMSAMGARARQDALTGCAHMSGKTNLCEHGACTRVRSQGRCGSCWAFATTAVVENTIRRNDWTARDLSEQYLVSCNDRAVFGYCDGSMYFGDGFDYYQDTFSSSKGELAAGAVYESDFKYAASNYLEDGVVTSCNGPHPHHERIDSWEQAGGVFGAGDACVKQLLDDGRFLTTFVDATNWDGYQGGVRVGSSLAIANHVVTLVGYDDEQGVWIVRNSWGPYWGETADGQPKSYGPNGWNGGYMRIRYGGDAVAHDVGWVNYTPNQATRASLVMTVVH